MNEVKPFGIEALKREIKDTYEEYYENHIENIDFDSLKRVSKVQKASDIKIEPEIYMFSKNGIETYYNITVNHKVEIWDENDKEITVTTSTLSCKTIDSICENLFDQMECAIDKFEPDELLEEDWR